MEALAVRSSEDTVPRRIPRESLDSALLRPAVHLPSRSAALRSPICVSSAAGGGCERGITSVFVVAEQ